MNGGGGGGTVLPEEPKRIKQGAIRVFLHDWKETGLEGMKGDFSISDTELEGAEILLASYTDENYSGDAFVLFRRDGKLYEVNGSHCSCFGLENQWEPEETDAVALFHRLDNGTLGNDAYNEFAGELRTVLAKLSQ